MLFFSLKKMVLLNDILIQWFPAFWIKCELLKWKYLEKIFLNNSSRDYFTYKLLHTSFQKQPPEVFYKKKVFLNISQISHENPCSRVSFLIKL